MIASLELANSPKEAHVTLNTSERRAPHANTLHAALVMNIDPRRDSWSRVVSENDIITGPEAPGCLFHLISDCTLRNRCSRPAYYAGVAAVASNVIDELASHFLLGGDIAGHWRVRHWPIRDVH